MRSRPSRSPSICFLNGLLLVVLGLDDAVAAVVAAVNDADRIAEIGVAEDEEAVAQQVHLQNGLVPGHGLDGEGLAADDAILALLGLVGGEGGKVLHVQRPLKGALAQPLLQAGLVLADLTLQRGHSRVDGGVHIRGAFRHAEDGPAGADGDLHLVQPLLLHAE